MRSGISGYHERSRVNVAAVRQASVVYQKSEGPGQGTLQPSEEVDPCKQAERFVTRVAGPTEVAWAQRKMDDYHSLRQRRLRIATFRHKLLQKAVSNAQNEEAAITVAKQNNFLATTTPQMLQQCRRAGLDSTAVDDQLKYFFAHFASPEQLQMVLPNAVLQSVEEKVAQLREDMVREHAAQLQQD